MNRGTAAGVVLALVLVARGLSALGGYDLVADVDPGRAGLAPGPSHWLGTDALGRDILWRVIKSTDAFVVPAVASATLAVLAGGLAGTVGGWFSGPIASTLSSAAGLPATVPRFVLVLLLATIFRPTPSVLAIGCGVAFVPAVTAEVQSRVSALRQQSFVTASLVHGLSIPRVIGHHVLWTGCRHVLARLALEAVAFFVVVETSLAYLGDMGVQEPTPSWGNMVASGLVDGRLHAVARLAPAVALWAVLAAISQLVAELGRRERTP